MKNWKEALFIFFILVIDIWVLVKFVHKDDKAVKSEFRKGEVLREIIKGSDSVKVVERSVKRSVKVKKNGVAVVVKDTAVVGTVGVREIGFDSVAVDLDLIYSEKKFFRVDTLRESRIDTLVNTVTVEASFWDKYLIPIISVVVVVAVAFSD